MIVRFDSKKLQTNTTSDIGVETETSHEKGAISEVEMLVSEARRTSIAIGEDAVDDTSDELKDIKEQEEASFLRVTIRDNRSYSCQSVY